jgi:tetratricopeptide (TPR) repeat protein
VGAFVGRDGLFFTLEIAARHQRVILLYGQGGAGKTELAKAFGRWWRDTGGVERPEWVIWHSFKPGVASFGLGGVVAEIGLRIFGSDFVRLDPAERLEIVFRLLAERRILLIWDNFEAVRSIPDLTGVTPPLETADQQELARFLARVAAEGESAVIVTSRTEEAWLGDLRRISVGGLAPDEAIEYADQLLAAYPGAAPRRAKRNFAELMEWFDGHPLGMRVVLPYLETTNPGALLAGLQGTTELPGLEGVLAASITYSVDHLTTDIRRKLVAVSLFQGVADVIVLSILSGVSSVSQRFSGSTRDDWMMVLDQAARVGLLTRISTTMYEIHPVLPAYLANQWRLEAGTVYQQEHATAEAASLNAHVTLANWLNEQIRGGDASAVFTLIDHQRRTLSSMLGYALNHQLWEQAHPIARVLAEYWNVRGLTEEMQGWVDRALLALETADSTLRALNAPAEALWLHFVSIQADLKLAAHQLDAGERTYLDILDMLQQQPESPVQLGNLAVTYLKLGNVARLRGHVGDAPNWYLQCLTIEKKLGDRRSMAGTYHELGWLAQMRGRPDDAEEWHREALTIQMEFGDRRGMALSYHELGNVARVRRRLDTAENLYRQSQTIFEEVGDLRNMAISYHALGIAAQEQGRLDDAEDWHRNSLTIRVKLADQPGMATSYHELGLVALEQGRLDDAEDWHRKSLTIKTELGNRLGMASSAHALGLVSQKRGRLDDAEDWHRKSRAIREELNDRPGVANSYELSAVIAQERGRLDEAEDWHRKSLAIWEELDDRLAMARSFWMMGLLAETRKRPEKAMECMVECIALLDQDSPSSTGTVVTHLTRLAAELGVGALERCWYRATGGPVPQAVRDLMELGPPEDPK